MAAAVSKKKKATSLKPKHHIRLKNLSKLFHGLGVNISDHIETLGLDENELAEIRKEFGAKSFLGVNDRALLRDVLSNLISLMKSTVVLEELLWKQVAPYVIAAYNRKFRPTNVIGLRALREIHKRTFHDKAADLKATLPSARKFLLSSFMQEEEFIFKKYPRLLNAVEGNLEDLVALEAKHEKIPQKARSDFLKQVKYVRQMLHDDVSFLTKDIAKLYDMRTDVYKWLIEADAAAVPQILPTLEKEYRDVLSARNYYIDNYRIHLRNVAEIYSGEGGEK